MKNRELIEDSEELRAAVADLKEKASRAEGVSPDTLSLDSASASLDTASLDMIPEDVEQAAEDAAYTIDEEDDMYDKPEEDQAGGDEEDPRDWERNIKKSEIFEKTLRETLPDGGEASAITKINEREREQRKAELQEREDEKIRKKLPGKKHKRNKFSDDSVITFDHVTKYYEHKTAPALNDVSLSIKKGEFVFIVGESGSGKSTLIRLLLRELKPTEGEIRVGEFNLSKLRRGKVPKLRRSMGVVFQDFRLLSDRNVYDNVAFAQRIVEASPREMRKNVPEILGKVGLAGKYRARTGELSGGEQQRVALARALVNRPAILLADEPTGNLDPKNTVEIMELLEQINREGTTVVVVTHNEKTVNDMHHRVITIKKGVVVSDIEEGKYADED